MSFDHGDNIPDPMHNVWREANGWWQELLGQKPVVAGFDKQKAKDSIPYSDVDAAEKIAEKMSDLLTYIEAFDEWYVWDGRIHRPLENDSPIEMLVKRFAKEYRDALAFVQTVYETEAAQLAQTQNQQAADKHMKDYRQGTFADHRRFRTSIHSNGGVRAVVARLRAELDRPSDYFSDDRRWLVCKNVVLDLEALRRGDMANVAVSGGDPTRRVTRYFKADYDPTAKAPNWEHFLESSVPDDDARRYLQKVAGCAFMAEPKLKTIMNLSGPPNSGKSLFVDTLYTLGKGGSSYSSSPKADALMQTQGTNFEQDKLRNMRFVGISEPNPNDHLDEGFVKKVSGGDWTETRTLHKASTGWYPQCVMFAASNAPVRFNTRDEALLERVSVVDFPHRFLGPDMIKPERGDKPRIDGLEDMLLDEASGILTWLVQGMMLYLQEGLKQPESVKKNRHDTKYSSSASLRWVKEFIDEELLVEVPEDERDDYPKSHWLDSKVAWDAYMQWANESNERFKLSKTTFFSDLEEVYGERVMSGGRRFRGLVQTDKWKNSHQGFTIGGHTYHF